MGAGRDARPIRFGTSGWRGVLGDEVTDLRLRALARGAAAWWRESGGSGRVLVAFDGRFASERLARLAHAELRAAGLDAKLLDGPCPTPVVSSTVARTRTIGAFLLTASHNPPQDHGVKIFDAPGCIADRAASQRIEVHTARALRDLRAKPDATPEPARPPRRLSLCDAYVSRVVGELDVRAIRRARPLVVYDALHGAGAAVVPQLLERVGARVHGLRLDGDPRFGGHAPDPRPERLAELGREVRRTGAAFGIANDGDGDRFAVVDERGRVLGEARGAALLVDALAERGRAGRGVALTRATGSLVSGVADGHGLDVLRTRMGFKWLSRELLEGRAGVACDESGGFAWAAVGPDKDGLAAAALLAERVATRGSLARACSALERKVGAGAAGRSAVPASPARRAAVEALCARPPDRVGRSAVSDVDLEEGLWLGLADGFAMLRASGTEPLVRLYAEAPTPKALDARLAALRRLLDGRARDL